MHVVNLRNLAHLYLAGGAVAEHYTTKRRGRSYPDPIRDRAAHSAALLASLNQALAAVPHQAIAPPQGEVVRPSGFYLEFRLPRGEEDFADKLEDRRRHIELVTVKPLEDGVSATVWVPLTAAEHFKKKIETYRDELTKGGKPKNQPLVSRIDSVALGALRSLYSDEDRLFPVDEVPIWWEVWVRQGQTEEFVAAARAADARVSEQVLRFAEREVSLVFASAATLGNLMVNSNTVAEVRCATDTPGTFVSMPNVEQREWAEDLTARLRLPQDGCPAVCILDSGVTRMHPLITSSLSAEDAHRYDPNWPEGDSDHWRGHGTRMAGLVLYGDLHAPLSTAQPVPLSHKLESVTILNPSGGQHNPKLYGAITQEAVARAEVQAPNRKRIVCMAVTSDVDTLRGKPSSWSAALDDCAYGNGERQRLFLVSAGNIRDNIRREDYPQRNDTEPIENPAQAWNVLTVGGYTDKAIIADPALNGWNALAPAGNLAPTTRTSVSWDRDWPVKPDIVLEAGNLATDGQVCSQADDLSLLSTYHRPNEKHFEIFGDTSAATGIAANLAGQLVAARPALWPETVRALIVHSAEWTPAMRQQFDEVPRKSDRLPLLRRYGYGVPSLERALFSALNDMTLIVESEVQPFWKDVEHEGRVKTRHMNLHQLPWPRAELLALGEAPVELRLTLSYFIEPNPGERGWTRRHRYASYGLRFAMKTSTEQLPEFRARINRAVQLEDAGMIAAESSEDWYLGQMRDAGSVHSDLWRGTAADLATRDAIAVFPVSGWWKEKPALERYDRRARYSMIVSIHAPGAAVDIYTPVQTAIQTMIAIQ
jgi:hypothetical protein